MIRRPAQQILSFNAGSLSPAAIKRVDMKQYYAGAQVMRGWQSIPQGGATVMPGTRIVGRARRPLTLLGQVGPLSTTGARPITLATLDLGSVQNVAVVEWAFTAASASNTGTDSVVVEAQNPSTLAWEQIGLAMNHGGTRERRSALPLGQPRSCRNLRLRVIDTNATSWTWNNVRLVAYGEGTGAPVVRGFSFLAGEGREFDALISPGHMDILLGSTLVGAARINATVDHVPREKQVQIQDTAILTHQGHAPWRVRRTRVDANHEWEGVAAPFVGVPNVDLGGTYTSTAERHVLYLTFTSGGAVGLTMTVNVNGEVTGSVTVAAGPNWTTFCSDLAAALVLLPSLVGGTVTVTRLADTATSAQIQIEFGGSLAGKQYTVSGSIVAMSGTNTGAVQAARTVKGNPGGEAIMSISAGWPEIITFFQERFILAGFARRPSAVLASQAGEFYQLDTGIEIATGPILVDVGNIGGETIAWLPRGRHLNVFTTRSDYYIRNQQLSRSVPLDVAISNATGVARDVPPVENEGAIVYASANRALIYEGRYSDVSQTYEQTPISLLADHLIVGLKVMALQRASVATDAARLWCVMDDGSVVVGILIRGQEVTAFVEYPVFGRARDVWVNGRNEVNFLIERDVGTGVELYHERVEEGLWLFGAVTGVVQGDGVTVTGLGAHEGRPVWAQADGWFVGPFTVTGGQITLPRAATSVTVGRWESPILKPLPMSRQVNETRTLNRPTRVHGVWLDVVNTPGISVGANGQPPREVALFKAGASPVDQPPQPVTRELDVDGLMGWTEQTDVTIALPRPGPATVRAMQIFART